MHDGYSIGHHTEYTPLHCIGGHVGPGLCAHHFDQSSFLFAICIISKGDLFIILLRYVRDVSHGRPLARLPSTNPLTTKPSQIIFPYDMSQKNCNTYITVSINNDLCVFIRRYTYSMLSLYFHKILSIILYIPGLQCFELFHHVLMN